MTLRDAADTLGCRVKTVRKIVFEHPEAFGPKQYVYTKHGPARLLSPEDFAVLTRMVGRNLGHTSKGPERRPEPQYVYIVQAGEQVKIGVSGNVTKRLRSLQLMSPIPITLRCAFPGGVERERELHERFQAHALWGEWFKLTPDLEQFIVAQSTLSSLS